MDIVREFTPEQLAYWADYAPVQMTFTAPDEQAVGIEPCIGLVTKPRTPEDLEVNCVRVGWKPNEIDMANLIAGGTVWLSCWGGLPPHQIEVQPPR